MTGAWTSPVTDRSGQLPWLPTGTTASREARGTGPLCEVPGGTGTRYGLTGVTCGDRYLDWGGHRRQRCLVTGARCRVRYRGASAGRPVTRRACLVTGVRFGIRRTRHRCLVLNDGSRDRTLGTRLAAFAAGPCWAGAWFRSLSLLGGLASAPLGAIGGLPTLALGPWVLAPSLGMGGKPRPRCKRRSSLVHDIIFCLFML